VFADTAVIIWAIAEKFRGFGIQRKAEFVEFGAFDFAGEGVAGSFDAPDVAIMKKAFAFAIAAGVGKVAEEGLRKHISKIRNGPDIPQKPSPN